MGGWLDGKWICGAPVRELHVMPDIGAFFVAAFAASIAAPFLVHFSWIFSWNVSFQFWVHFFVQVSSLFA